MTVGFLTHYDSSNVRAWSGTPYHMMQALRQSGIQVEAIGPLCEAAVFPFRVRNYVEKRMGWKQHLWDREPAVAAMYGRAAQRALAKTKADLILSPGTIAISRLRCPQPIVFWSDMIFPSLFDYYLPRDKVSDHSARVGNEMDQNGFDRSALALFSSDWAASLARATYRCDPSKVRTVPYGANISWDFSEAQVNRAIEGRSKEVCRLVFIGVDWERKGGALAVEAARLMNLGGMKTHLTIIGSGPATPLPDFCTLHAFLDKSVPGDMETFQQALTGAHFLLLPSRADCTPMVIGEANSAGVPCACSDVGGLPSQVLDGLNGKIFSSASAPDVWAEWLIGVMSTPGRYDELARSSFREYQTRLNWTSCVASFQRELIGAGLMDSVEFLR